MAAKKSNAIEMGLGALAVLAVLYFAYKLFFGQRVQAASSTGGLSGGGYGGYSSSPYSPYSPYTTASTTSGIGSLLNSLMKAMGGGGGGKSGGGTSGGSGGGSSAAKTAAQSQSQLQSEMQQIAGYSSTANNLPNFSDLGGNSLVNLPAGYDASGVDLSGDYIPQEAVQSFDFGSNYYEPTPDLAGYQSYGGPIDSMDTGDYSDLGEIDSGD